MDRFHNNWDVECNSRSMPRRVRSGAGPRLQPGLGLVLGLVLGSETGRRWL